MDPCFDLDLFAHDLDFFFAVQKLPAFGAFCLITCEQDVRTLFPEVVSQMMQDPACIAHAAG